ncbi:protein FAM234A [Chiloscyllium plagiosum]|uniref:protein FAM234A n=1 Tax=Chiloscyllium plagiosum TaxID=36176 RepID=UPI001CB865F9|nr:protein FAM234A [Chiloscyllium plagiosum]XP_043567095.1 protein FAM234A [Chiloscyllium plagiosum]
MTENQDSEGEIHPLKNDEVRNQDTNDISNRHKGTKIKKFTKFGQLSHWRTAAFFVALFLCLIVVFAFSFIIPCPVRPVSQRAWNKTFENAVSYPFFTLWDMNRDKVSDVIFALKYSNNTIVNGSCAAEGLTFPCAYVTVLSGTNGSLLWQRALAEDVQHVQCGIEHLSGMETSGCLIIGTPYLVTAISSSGNTLWILNASFAVNLSVIGPALILPDLDGDGVGDLLIFFTPNQVSSVSKLILQLLSGKSGDPIGQEVYHNVTENFEPLSPLIHITNTGAYYVLFIEGTVQGVALKDIYLQATGMLQTANKLNADVLKSDSEWEKKTDPVLKKIQIHNSRTAKYLQVVHAQGEKAGKLLISTEDRVELLDGQNLQTYWLHNISHLQGAPVSGYFNADDVFDFLIEDFIEKNRKKITIVDGKTGKILWEEDLICRKDCPKPSTINTVSRTAFLFWGELPTHTNGSVPEDLTENRHYLYMAHPSHPYVMLELKNTTENVLSFTTALFESSRHACNVLLLGQPVGSKQGPLTIIKQKLKESISFSTVRRLNKGHDVFSDAEIKEYYYRIRYRN